jgi:hypothetical protein
VFVHGTYGSGDNIGNVALLFGSNGYCQDRFVAVEYNSLGGSPLADLDNDGVPNHAPNAEKTIGGEPLPLADDVPDQAVVHDVRVAHGGHDERER